MALLDESPQSEAATPLITEVERVELTAPLALPEGYGLEVSTSGPNGSVVHSSVVVPEGGVVEGERFTANLTATGTSTSTHYMEVPSDQWRDSIFSCLKHGLFHPVVCLGLFCFPIPLGQVMTRMDLNWLGDYRDPDSQHGGVRVSAFKVVMFVMTVYLVLGTLYFAKRNLLEEMMELELPLPVFLPMNMSPWDFLFWVYCFFLVMKTRSYIRRRYAIAEGGCTGFEDCFCAFFCLPLTICQMARHTADYETYRATYCSETGLPPNAPQIV